MVLVCFSKNLSKTLFPSQGKGTKSNLTKKTAEVYYSPSVIHLKPNGFIEKVLRNCIVGKDTSLGILATTVNLYL